MISQFKTPIEIMMTQGEYIWKMCGSKKICPCTCSAAIKRQRNKEKKRKGER